MLYNLELIIELDLSVLEKMVQREHLPGRGKSRGILDIERDLESRRGPHPVLNSALGGAKLPRVKATGAPRQGRDRFSALEQSDFREPYGHKP